MHYSVPTTKNVDVQRRTAGSCCGRIKMQERKPMYLCLNHKTIGFLTCIPSREFERLSLLCDMYL